MVGVFNQIKTIILLGVLTGLLIGVGGLFGREGLLIGLIFALLMNFFAYWFSDKIVLRMYRAREVSKKDNPKLHELIEDLCKKADIPKPKIYIVPSDTANAFATGRNKKHASVAVTEGILNLLNEKELKGVLAHEISHVKNRDILIATIAATIAGVISYVAMMARWSLFFGRNENRGMGNLIGIIVLAILAPLIALIIQLAISRSREYLADESGAKLSEPTGLANALDKLARNAKIHPLKFGSEATSHLFIVNPFSGKSFVTLFSTHPPMDERIKRLKAMV